MTDRESNSDEPKRTPRHVETRDRQRSTRGRDGVGPIALLLPVAFALLTFAFLRGRLQRDNEGPRAVPPTATSHQEVAGWSGELAARGAEPEQASNSGTAGPLSRETDARLVASLRPLQSLPDRQAFDVAALRKRFGFESGEPWRLELRYRRALEDELIQPLAIRDFSEITVFDEIGPALTPLGAKSGVNGELRVDPLRVLCSVPEVPLRPGYELTVFLWGRRPEGSLRLEGLRGGPFEEVSALTLIPRSLPAEPLHESLATLERLEKR